MRVLRPGRNLSQGDTQGIEVHGGSMDHEGD